MIDTGRFESSALLCGGSGDGEIRITENAAAGMSVLKNQEIK
jgi:hypothetical protein